MENYVITDVGLIPQSWKVEKLGDLGFFKNGIHKDKDDFGFGYPMVNLNHVFSNFSINNSMSFDLVNANENERKNYALKKGDILFIRSSVKPEGVGLTSVVDYDLEDTTYSGFIIRFRLHKDYLVHKFKHYVFYENRFRHRLICKSSVSANTNINQSALNSLKIPIPPKEEQKAIADCLSTWDVAIEKQTKLIAAKEQRKKALMQQLLSGKKRLPGFEKKWKLHSIEELFIFKNGKAHENVIDEEGKFILINSKFISSNSQVVKRTNKNLSPLKIDDLVFVMSDVPKGKALGKFFYVDKDGLYTLNQRIGLLQIKTGNPKFMYYLLNRNRHFLSFDNGVGQTNLRKDDILECPLLIPDLDEQNEIANFISFIDREYQLELLKLDKLKTQKKGMMQKLLTGKIRLIA